MRRLTRQREVPLLWFEYEPPPKSSYGKGLVLAGSAISGGIRNIRRSKLEGAGHWRCALKGYVLSHAPSHLGEQLCATTHSHHHDVLPL